jgi:hypothetical protein
VLPYTPVVHAVNLLAYLYHILNLEKDGELIQHRFLGPNDKLQALVDDFQVSISYKYLWTRGKSQEDRMIGELRQSPGFYLSCNRDRSFRSLSKQGVHHKRSDAPGVGYSTYF